MQNNRFQALDGTRITRRQSLHRGALYALGTLLAERLCWGQLLPGGWDQDEGRPGVQAASAPVAGNARAVIQIWLAGGPPHTDTFDPKPQAGKDYTGPLSGSAATSIAGIHLGQMMPQLAAIADRYSLIRSMTHGQNGHETASYLTQTGRMPGRRVYPAAGAVVNAFRGVGAASQNQNPSDQSSDLIPPYIVLTRPQGRFSEAGFLGIRYKPFATGGDPNANRFAVEGIVTPGISDEQQFRRKQMRQQLGSFSDHWKDHPEMQSAKQARASAYDMILGESGKVFDLSEEEQSLRDRYGRTTFGQSCLAARRLIQAGAKFITVNFGGWDTHKKHFESMRRLLPDLDRGLSALITDLHDRGMLESTIVWCTGEFGRTPKVAWESPWNGGRHHFGSVFSSLVAGGGFQGGRVLGASNPTGEEVAERPVFPCDLLGTMYELLGIDPLAPLPHPLGEQVTATPSAEENVPSAGRLYELI